MNHIYCIYVYVYKIIVFTSYTSIQIQTEAMLEICIYINNEAAMLEIKAMLEFIYSFT